MLAIIQENQPLFIFNLLFLLLLAVLWALYQWVIAYSQQLFSQFFQYGREVKHYSGKSTVLIRFKYNYPKAFDFLSKRLQRQHFYGLPLTFLLVAMGYIVALFIGLVEDVVTSDTIVTIEHAVSVQMQGLRYPSLVDCFAFITSFGSGFIPYLVVMLVGIICLMMRKPYLLIGLLVSTLGSTAFTSLSKLIFHRSRPAGALVFEQSFSFPSGHATLAVALYGFLGYLLIRFSTEFVRQVRVFFMTLLFAILIGLSRIVLNVHYLSDVLGGFLVGTLWLLIGISLTEWLTANHKISWQLADSSV